MYYDESCICLLENCNWNCKYCITVDNSVKIDEDYIFSEFYKIKDIVQGKLISGGEPGLLSESFWTNVFNCVDSKLNICTNGTFIKRGYFSKFRKQIKQLILHCSSELDCDIDDDILHFLKDSKNRLLVLPVIVVHKHNSHLVKQFLERYKDIGYIDLHLTDSRFSRISKTPNYDYVIDRESAQIIIKQLGSFRQYKDVLTRLIIAIMDNDFSKLNLRSNRYYYPGR